MRKTIDGRDLSPPEPLERALAALDELGANDELLLILKRRPFLLYPALRHNGYTWHEVLREDGVFEIYIRRKP